MNSRESDLCFARVNVTGSLKTRKTLDTVPWVRDLVPIVQVPSHAEFETLFRGVSSTMRLYAWAHARAAGERAAVTPLVVNNLDMQAVAISAAVLAFFVLVVIVVCCCSCIPCCPLARKKLPVMSMQMDTSRGDGDPFAGVESQDESEDGGPDTGPPTIPQCTVRTLWHHVQ